MNDIQDYATFAREMDKMYNESSFREQSLITRAFRDKDNANFERYSQERQMLQDLIEQVSSSDNHKGMSNNDKEMFAHTITYLSDKGIDFNDNQAVVDALSAVDENGVSEFRKYVEEVNSTIPEAEQAAFTSVGEAIQNFNDVMATYNKENAQREANEAPIEVTPTTPEQSAPATSPEPVVQRGATETKTKSIFDIAGSSTPEGGYIAGDGSVISNEDMPTETAQTETESNQPTNNATSTEKRNSIIQAFADNSNEDVAKAAEIALNIAKNQPDRGFNVKDDVRQFIESLSTNSFENVEDFVDALISSANTRETSSEDGTDPRANLLRQIAAKINAAETSKQSITEEKKSKSSLLDKKRQQLDNTNRQLNSNYNMFPNANSSSSFIASVNIDNIRQRFPNSPIIKYYEKYNIEEALRAGILDNNPDIFFITDEEFSDAVKQDMESNGYTYNPEVSMPIIAVVESKNGPVVIGDKKYQPISVMSSTNHLGSAGSTHMAPIRNAAQSNTGTQLISINGKAIVTKAYGKPKAYSADINYRGRNNVTDIAINDLSQDERTSLESQDKKQRRRNPAYQKAKRNFLKGLGTKMIGGRKALVFNQPTLNGRFNQIEIFVSPINESTARNSDNTFEDEARDGDIINFNSRTSRAAKALETFVKSFNSDDLVYEEIDGQIVPTEATAGALQTMANNLQKKIDNFINIPIKDGWEYRITPTSEVDGDNRIMDLSLVNPNTSETIPLATFNSGMTEQDIKDFKDDFIRNLILDDSGKVRMTSSNDSFAKWNVLYSDAEKTSESKAAADNISDIYEDGILGAAATTFNYRIQGIAVQNPFKADGTPAFTETANAVNAQSQQSVTTPTIAEGQVKSGNAIVTDTGVVLDGKPSTPTNPARERAANIATQIEDDSKHIKLADDNSGYIDTRTGKKYARVTSVISADERAGERFDPNNPWVVPSTNIGIGFDEFVRDFFAGKLDNITTSNNAITELSEKYPNATEEALQKFREQLMGLRNNFISNGLTIVPRGITVTGSLDVLDSNGKIHTVDVAGTLDLLAYDGNGNFFIFDMKTNRSGIDQHKQEKYSRQLSLYKKFLENKYGIQVKSLNLIPISVKYPAPSGWRNGSADYSVSPEKANQLMIDGKNYTGANPILQDTIAVNYTEPHIVWEKMTDEERAMFGEVENTVKAETNNEAKPTEAIPSESPTETVDPILGTQFNEDYLGNMFGVEVTELNNYSMDITTRSTPIPEKYQWNNLTQEQREGIEMQGFNETSWSSLEDEEMEHKLKCLGL